MSQQPKPKQTSPLVIAMLGLILIVFGIADIIIDKMLIGILLLGVGLILGINGIQRYKVLKAQLQQKKPSHSCTKKPQPVCVTLGLRFYVNHACTFA